MPRGRYQQKQWEAREAAILEALEELSLERGFANIPMDDLADMVGISKATVYQHFDSKDSMLVRLMAQHEQRFIDRVQATIAQPPLQRMREIVRILMGEPITPLRGLVRMGPDVLPVFRSSPELLALHDQIITLLTDIIRQGQAAGSVASDLAPHVIICAMLALSSVSIDQSRPSQENQDYAEQMLTLFERGIRPG